MASAALVVSDSWKGVLVDISKCIGCRRCEFACKEAAQKAAEIRANGIIEKKANELGVEKDNVRASFTARDELRQAALFKPDPIERFEDKSIFDEERLRRPEPHCHTKINRFPNPKDETKPLYVKVNCFHCNKPSCVSACIVGAFRKLDNGAVIYDAWKCMGCRYCMVACAFGIPQYEYDNLLTPQVRKCTLCSDQGNLLDPELPDGHPNKGDVPACIKICPQDVMTYGKRSDLLALAHERIRTEPDTYVDHVYGEHEVGGTSWLYLAPKEKPFTDLGFLDLDSSAPPLRTEGIQHGVFKFFVPPVAWYGLLGAMMWITRPNPNEAGQASSEDHH